MSQDIYSESVPIPLPTDRTAFDPPVELARIREQFPICRLRYPDGHVGWLVTGHALARRVLSDSRFSMHPARLPVGDPEKRVAAFKDDSEFSDVTREAFLRYGGGGQALHRALEEPVILQELRRSPPSRFVLLFTDRPIHTRLRRALAGHFTVRRVKRRQSQIEQIVARRLDAMEVAKPPVDLVETYALPVASLAICGLLGAPPEDRGQFESATAIFFDPDSSVEDEVAAEQRLRAYVRRLIEQKRMQPGEDLLSDLVREDRLSEDELVGLAMLLFVAGHHTTANMLALATFAALQDRSRWESLLTNPGSIGDAIEEFMRYLTPNQVSAHPRTALEDVHVAGVLIKAGESVAISLSAANRDPSRFVEPDKLDLSRDASGHLAFGYGIHQCLGQHLARLELQSAFAGLIRRLPTLRLAIPANDVPLYDGDCFIYGVRELPVTW